MRLRSARVLRAHNGAIGQPWEISSVTRGSDDGPQDAAGLDVIVTKFREVTPDQNLRVVQRRVPPTWIARTSFFGRQAEICRLPGIQRQPHPQVTVFSLRVPRTPIDSHRRRRLVGPLLAHETVVASGCFAVRQRETTGVEPNLNLAV